MESLSGLSESKGLISERLEPSYGQRTLALVVWAPMMAVKAIRRDPEEWASPSFLAISAASAVASSWVILFVGGRWRADSAWSDRLGRLLAVSWLMPLPLYILVSVIVF
jgi:hypothetical protein